ncbi:MAG: hypothetical protein QOH14_1105, partial [Pseudonocardiales bacterium]|nr:hypothetical protein [Pseudonocardiales bacterium]
MIARTCEYDRRPELIVSASAGNAASARATRTCSTAVRRDNPQVCDSHRAAEASPQCAYPSRASNSATSSNQRHVAAANRPASPTIREPSSSTDSAPSGVADGTSRNTGSTPEVP